MNNGYNGCSRTICRTPDDIFFNWIYGAMTTMGESRKGTPTPNKFLADPKTKIKVGWRTVERQLEEKGLKSWAEVESAAEDMSAWKQRGGSSILN